MAGEVFSYLLAYEEQAFVGGVFAYGVSRGRCRGYGRRLGDREVGGIVGGGDEGDVVSGDAWIGCAVFAVKVVDLFESRVSVCCKAGMPLESYMVPRLTTSAFSPTTSACPIVTHGLSKSANS